MIKENYYVEDFLGYLTNEALEVIDSVASYGEGGE